MRIRNAIALVVSLGFGLLSHGAHAASYQKTDGTIVDPILRFQSALPNWQGPAIAHPYSGPNLTPGASLNAAHLESADLRSANLIGADLSGSFLYSTYLLGANLTDASLSGAQLTGAYYDAATIFPLGIDPVVSLMTEVKLINNGLAPPNPDNLIDAPNYTNGEAYSHILFVNNEGCDSMVEHPCVDPGTPTAASGTGHVVVASETSSFSGSIYSFGSVWARDSSAVTINAAAGIYSQDVSFHARDSSTLIVNACGEFCNLSAGGTSIVSASGFFEWISAFDQSVVSFSGYTDQGDGIEVFDQSTVYFSGDISRLLVRGGTVFVDGGHVAYTVVVDQGGVVEIGNNGQLEGYFVIDIAGKLVMRGGRLGDNSSDVLERIAVNGYALLDGGVIVSNGNDPRWLDAFASGLIDLRRSSLDQLIRIRARDTARVRIFGSNFAIDSEPIGLGSIGAASGQLSGELESGAALDNPVFHRGADCGGQPCTGRILVLAPGLDWDQDTIPNPFDNCAEEPNLDQTDANLDGTGDICFAAVDLDRDGIIDALDNCRVDANPNQADVDSDGVGDACESQLVVWSDPGLQGCTSPPQKWPYTAVTSDLADEDVINRSAQPCNCFGVELPVLPGTSSVRFVHRLPSGAVEEFCENVTPYALGLAPGQAICAAGLNEDGVHQVMATPFDAPDCEAGTGEALASSIRRFSVVPEPGMALMLGMGVAGLAGLGRQRQEVRTEARSGTERDSNGPM